MAGEMSQADVTREEFPMYFAISDWCQGEVIAFDVYQGPYVRSKLGKFWIVGHESGECTVYNERNGKESAPFWPHWKDDETANTFAVSAAQEVAAQNISVIYRMSRGEVVAAISGYECNPGMVMSYMHIGQHSEASKSWFTNLKAARPEQYAEIHKELKGIYEVDGDTLVIMKRMQGKQWK